MAQNNSYVNVIAFLSALGGLLFGYDTGVISGAILFIRNDFALETSQVELVVSIVLLGCVIGASCAGVLADRFGRRTLLIFSALLFTAASLMTAIIVNVEWLVVGRFFIGIAIGFSSMITPLYIAEISPPASRGRLVSLNQLAITVGIVASYSVAYLFSESGKWNWMLGIAIVPSIIFGVSMFFLPESPRWLYIRGMIEKAHHILTMIHGKENADHEIAEIKQSLIAAEKDEKVVMTPWLRRTLVIGIGLAVFQQLTGINTVIYYAPIIFEFAGFKTASTAILATGVVGVINVLATLVALWLLDKAGRRTLLLTGLTMMIVSLAILGASFQFPASHFFGWLTLASLMLYVAAFAISLGPVFWLLIAEIYPLTIRGKAMSVATFFNWASNLLVAFTFLTLVNILGISGTFWFYGIMAIIALVFSYFLVPETKNKTLEEIELEETSV